MNKNQVTDSKAQGAAPVKSLDAKTIASYLKKDLEVAIGCLNALHSDPDLLMAMATFMQGRMENAVRAKESKLQENG